jgi:hypothetical protein
MNGRRIGPADRSAIGVQDITVYEWSDPLARRNTPNMARPYIADPTHMNIEDMIIRIRQPSHKLRAFIEKWNHYLLLS